MNLTTALYLLEETVRQVRQVRRQRAHNHGGDETRAPAPAEPATEQDEQIRQEWLDDHPQTGLEELAVRAARHEQARETDDEDDKDEDAQSRIYPGDGQFVETSVGVKQLEYDGAPGLLFYDKNDTLPTERWVFAQNDALIDTEGVR